MERTAATTVLVYVGLDLVGDGLIKLPFVRALRRAYPDAHLSWLAGTGRSVFADALAPLVAGLIDQVVDDVALGGRAAELFTAPLANSQLAGRRFDLVLDTQRRVLTTLIVRRIPHRTFVSGAARFLLSDRRPADRRKPPGMVHQMLALLEAASGRPAEPFGTVALATAYTAAAREVLPPGPVYVGIAPGAGGRQKCWPLESFVDLARRLAARGKTPVFLLGPGEVDWVGRLRAEVPEALLPLQSEPARRFGATPLITIALAGRLAAAVANDSGAGHMLAAADAPLLTLFGPTDPAKFAPLVSRGTILTAQAFAAGSMAAIPVEAVDQALAALLRAALAGA